MALTKVTKSGLADNSVDAAKLVDGTVVAADINDGTITNAKLAGSIANNKLANSSITLNGSALALGDSASVLAFAWQAVVTSDTTMVSGRGYFVNTTSGAITMTLPASPSAGDYVAIKDYAATFQTNSCTIGRNSSNIQGNASNSEITTTRASVVLVYADATKGWLYTNESNIADFGPQYVTATGGTVSTTGNYKIHLFNSSSNFVVSDAGNSSGSNKVSYLVIAGGSGGANQGGGGGAGGFREGRDSPKDSYTASPLAASDSGLSVTTQTYPVTVGGGGAGAATPNSYLAQAGSNSVFSTITSAAGGRGANLDSSPRGDDSWHAGGSGGGGAGQYAPVCAPTANRQGGIGNTPPVSPSQGNNGGDGHPGGGSYVHASGGGGGAGGVGADYVGAITAGAGGNGASSEISGSAVTRAGGGGGAANNSGGSGGAAGPGGGSAGTAGNNNASNATANTGGGGGGTGNDPNSAGSGGSGVVIIRYKYQN